jgi:hypothetical protein
MLITAGNVADLCAERQVLYYLMPSSRLHQVRPPLQCHQYRAVRKQVAFHWSRERLPCTLGHQLGKRPRKEALRSPDRRSPKPLLLLRDKDGGKGALLQQDRHPPRVPPHGVGKPFRKASLRAAALGPDKPSRRRLL